MGVGGHFRGDGAREAGLADPRRAREEENLRAALADSGHQGGDLTLLLDATHQWPHHSPP